MTVDTALATLQTIDLNGQWVVTDESRPSGTGISILIVCQNMHQNAPGVRF
jgi:hypothetical protein